MITSDEQLDLWVAGEAVHAGRNRKEGNCCPDFSCCNPAAFTEKSEREAFRDANEDGRVNMLLIFLQRAFGPDVYIVGDPVNYQVPS